LVIEQDTRTFSAKRLVGSGAPGEGMIYPSSHCYGVWRGRTTNGLLVQCYLLKELVAGLTNASNHGVWYIHADRYWSTCKLPRKW